MKMTLDVNKYRPFEYAGFGYLEGTGDTSWKVEDTFGRSQVERLARFIFAYEPSI